MRISGLVLLGLIVLPVFAAEPVPPRPVTVAQLEQMLGEPQRSDRDMAQLLFGLELTQRLSPERFKRLNEALPGRRSREALLVMSDLAAFLDLPAAEVPADAPPDAAVQKQMLSRAVDYVAAAVHRLPNFTVTRRLSRFEDLQVVRGVNDPVTVRTVPFRRLDRSRATVLFREGSEVVQPASANEAPPIWGLSDRGVFGLLLAMVTTDVLNGRIGFDHWEMAPSEEAPALPSPAGQPERTAVFRFLVPESESHYSVEFCCYSASDGWVRSYQATPRYHGELAIEPKSGAILRLVLKSDLDPSPLLHVEADSDKPLQRSDILMEYGPVTIGGQSYVCPLRSISVQTSWTRGDGGPASPIVQVDSKGHIRSARPVRPERVEYSRVTALNDYEFEAHHLFRGDVRMLPAAPEAVP